MDKAVLQLLDLAQEELEGADEYASLAKMYMAEDSKTGSMYAELTLQELNHVARLRTRATELVNSNPDPTDSFVQLWGWESARMADWEERVRKKLEQKH